MKSVIYTCVLAVGLVLFSFIGAANAAIGPVNYNGSYVDMGELSLGQYGTVYADKANGGIAMSQLRALLPSQASVTFSYNFVGGLQSGMLAAGGLYSYPDADGLHEGFAASLSNTSLNFSGSKINGTPIGTALAYASADLDVVADTASATIINGSGGFLDITSALFAIVGANKEYTISYQVTETPLPAALPMFALGLCAVAGVRKRKKADA